MEPRKVWGDTGAPNINPHLRRFYEPHYSSPRTRGNHNSRRSSRSHAVEEPTRETAPEERRLRDPALPLITDTQVALAEKSVSNIQRIRALALRVTSENDWT